jgi:hypothetical protein
MPERLTDLLPGRAVGGGLLAALVALFEVWWSLFTRGSAGLFNDFYDYWGAGVLLNRGQDPYDVAALTAVQHAAGLQNTTGSGYSYPLLFGELVRPLALMKPGIAALVFCVLSLVALWIAAALLLGSFDQLRWLEAGLGGAVVGLFPPVIGSLYFGQANLLVLLALAVAFRLVFAEPLLAVATVIKVYPISGFLESLAARRIRPVVVGLVTTGILLLAPQLFSRGSLAPRTGYFLSPDTYWSNQSINGFLSRLALPSRWTRPALPGLPVEPLVTAIAILLIIAVTVVLWRQGGRPYAGGLALAIWLGVVIAPKNSLWNDTPLLLGMAFAWPVLRRRPIALAVGAAGWLLIEAQTQLDTYRDTVYLGSPALSLLSSVGLYGALLLGAVTTLALLRPPRYPPRPSP